MSLLDYRNKNPEELVRQLVKDLKNPNPQIRQNAAFIFNNESKVSGFDMDGKPLYQDRVDKFNELCREIAMDSIIKGLHDKNRITKIDLIWCLGHLNDERAVKPLIKGLDDEEVIGATVINLINLKDYSYEPLLDALNSNSKNIRSGAAEALGEIGAEKAVESLVNSLLFDDFDLYTISNALIKINSNKAVEPLLSALNEVGDSKKRNIIYILSNIGDQRVIEPLINQLNAKSAHVRRRAVEALGNIKDKKAVEPLIEALNDKTVIVRSEAITSLGKIGDERPVELIIKMLEDKSKSVKMASINVLGKIGDDRALNYLKPLLKDNDSYIREITFKAIKNLESKDKISKVPEWNGYYPSLDSANEQQKTFYKKWESKFEKGNYLDIEGNLSYIFVFLYSVIEKFIKNKDITYLVNNFNKIEHAYPEYEKIKRYLIEWKSSAYLLVDDPKNALKTELEKDLTIYNALKFTAISDKSSSLIDGNDLVRLYPDALTDFGTKKRDEIEKVASDLLDNFEKNNGKHLLNYFLEEFNLRNLSESDLEELKNFFTNESKFLEYKKDYKLYKRSSMIINTDFEFKGFAGVPIRNAPYDDPKFKRLLDRDYDKKGIVIPQIVLEALISEIRSILRESENIVREERGLPKIGEGWISETNLFYKIKEEYSEEEVIHQGRPSWLNRQHLDIYFPKKNIGIEYQGNQHREPIDHFGGKEGLQKRLELDKRKERLCKENNCNLVYVYPDYNFDEVKKQIEKILKESNNNFIKLKQ